MKKKIIIKLLVVSLALSLAVFAICCPSTPRQSDSSVLLPCHFEMGTYNGQSKNPTESATNLSAITATPTPESEATATDGITAYFNEKLLPLVTAVGTAICALLAMLLPYIKTASKLKAARAAYTEVYESREELKATAQKVSAEELEKLIAETVKKDVEAVFARYDAALSKVLASGETVSAQITSLVEGAKLAWRDADGASVVLAKSPTASSLERQSLAIEFLKSFVAEKLGVEVSEIQKKIDEAVL